MGSLNGIRDRSMQGSFALSKSISAAKYLRAPGNQLDYISPDYISGKHINKGRYQFIFNLILPCTEYAHPMRTGIVSLMLSHQISFA